MVERREPVKCNGILGYTQDPEAAEKSSLRLISEDQFHDIEAFLDDNVDSVRIMTDYRRIGANEFEPAAYSYQYKGCKIRVQEPVSFDSRDEPCLTIIPFEGCNLARLLNDLGLSPLKPKTNTPKKYRPQIKQKE